MVSCGTIHGRFFSIYWMKLRIIMGIVKRRYGLNPKSTQFLAQNYLSLSPSYSSSTATFYLYAQSHCSCSSCQQIQSPFVSLITVVFSHQWLHVSPTMMLPLMFFSPSPLLSKMTVRWQEIDVYGSELRARVVSARQRWNCGIGSLDFVFPPLKSSLEFEDCFCFSIFSNINVMLHFNYKFV